MRDSSVNETTYIPSTGLSCLHNDFVVSHFLVSVIQMKIRIYDSVCRNK